MKFVSIFIFILLMLLTPALALAATDQEYENTGEQIMDQMMGSRHQEADQQIQEIMGSDFLTQMHIAMGKMAERNISGKGNFGIMPMMGIYTGGGGFNMMGNYGMFSGGFGFMAVLGWLTWVLVIIALALGIVWLWKQIQKK